jgi:hypothetical protein
VRNRFLREGYPFSICTDDFGVFDTSASKVGQVAVMMIVARSFCCSPLIILPENWSNPVNIRPWLLKMVDQRGWDSGLPALCPQALKTQGDGCAWRVG